jgi:hypothetical protein
MVRLLLISDRSPSTHIAGGRESWISDPRSGSRVDDPVGMGLIVRPDQSAVKVKFPDSTSIAINRCPATFAIVLPAMDFDVSSWLGSLYKGKVGRLRWRHAFVGFGFRAVGTAEHDLIDDGRLAHARHRGVGPPQAAGRD